jgi:malate dehydrogenase (oxaloacetate-decarboxylating)
MPSPSPGYSCTFRVESATDAHAAGVLASAADAAGAVVTALDVVDSGYAGMVVDLTCNCIDVAHTDMVEKALGDLPGVSVRAKSDRTFLLHLGGKLEVTPKVRLRHRDDLARAYTPGVARVCLALVQRPQDARRLTIKRNTVAIVTDGSAVLGLGNIGPIAALPVMEGKAALFKQFADVDAWPVCLDTQDVDEVVAAVRAIAPVYGGINLEDIAAPRCFEIERRLRAALDVPVFHDDQHGTAVVVTAALLNALRVVHKSIDRVRIVVCGAGAAGSAVIRLLELSGASDIVVYDRDGLLHQGRAGLDEHLARIAERTNPRSVQGDLRSALVGADVFIGVSAPDVVSGDDLAPMNEGAIVFALANPDPEVDPAVAAEHATVVATGRSDYPNQINNVLAFPGLFRGLLDTGAVEITDEMLTAAAAAIAACVSVPQLNPSYIIPSVFDPAVAPAVADAVRVAVNRSVPGAARAGTGA